MSIALPFIVQPKADAYEVGNEKLGTLEIPRFYSLSKEEEDFINVNTFNLLTTTELAISMAAVISASMEGSTIVDIGNALLVGDYDFFKKHLEDIFKYNKKVAENNKLRKLVTATAIIKYRLLSGWTLEDTCNPEKIRPALVDEIANFAIKEQGGWAGSEVVKSKQFDDIEQQVEAVS